MILHVLCVLIAVVPICVNAQVPAKKAPSDASTMIARALSWYGRWHTADETFGTQRCSGKRSGDSLVFSCFPLDVIVSVGFDADRECYIRFMRHGGGIPDHGAIGAHGSPITRRHCDGLPDSEGDFELDVEATIGENDLDLTRKAHAAALRYLRFWPGEGVAFFPKVRSGDPFFHVYLVREGSLEVVLEFRIVGGHPEDFSHWDYKRKGGGLPEGSVKRLAKPQLWLSSGSVGSGIDR